jgi:hypothetical protein
MAGRRQVPNAKIALQHNIGLGGAVVVALYKLGFPGATQERYTNNVCHCNVQTTSFIHSCFYIFFLEYLCMWL